MDNNGKRARRIAIVSGKGGVGKSVITANLAAELALLGRKTLVIDADLGLANLDIILDIEPRFTIFDVLYEGKRVEDVVIPTSKGFDLIPAGCSRPEGTVFTEGMARNMEGLLANLEKRYDVILFDAGAGIGDVVLYFANLAHEILLIATPEPTSVMDAYAMIKVLHQLHNRTEFLPVVNQAHPDHCSQVGTSIAGHLSAVTSKFLDPKNPVHIRLAGSIPADPAVVRAVRERKLVAETNREAPSAYLLQHLATFLDTRLAKFVM